MENYRIKQQELLNEVTGTRNVLDLPLVKFDKKENIIFKRIRGSVRLILERICTEKEVEETIQRVIHLRFP